jgi:hypothetical protein
MRLKVTEVGNGLHPSEKVISIDSRDGDQIVVVDPNSVRNGELEVGWPVGKQDDMYLVELPRPSSSGAWRIWVHVRNLIDDHVGREAVA